MRAYISFSLSLSLSVSLARFVAGEEEREENFVTYEENFDEVVDA